jgi:hypothetical protein
MDKNLTSKLFDKVIIIGEDVSSIKTTMSEHEKVFTEIKNTLTKIDSKHNQDYQQYVDSREKLEARFKPVEEDYFERCKLREENRVGLKKIFFSSSEKVVIYIGALILAGLIAFKEFIK